MNRTHAMSTPRGLTGRIGAALAAFAMLGLLAACSTDKILGGAKLPPDVIDPATMHNTAGALAAYRSAADLLRQGFDRHVWGSGLLADELTTTMVGRGVGYQISWYEYIDNRQLHAALSHSGSLLDRLSYSSLHRTRGQVRQALGMLREYAPGSSPALQGHLYAIDGYAKVLLAEQYCSGIPLSELIYRGDYRLEGPSSTTEVLERALASFDSAIAISADSARLLDFARVGRARTLLGLGRYAEAAAAVSAVPTGFRYEVLYPTDSMANLFKSTHPNPYSNLTVSDREGGNGLPFRSSGDPRTSAALLAPASGTFAAQYRPAKYNTMGTSPIVLASGIEARLVEAEAALAGGGDWLAILNALRTDGTFTTRPNATNPAVTDTLWNAGSGGVARLAPVADPGTAAGRVDLLFRERASWLYVTGHRLGDLRRLVRQYGRSPDDVFPIGPYLAANGSYGASVVIPVIRNETLYNPLYRGCLSEEA